MNQRLYANVHRKQKSHGHYYVRQPTTGTRNLDMSSADDPNQNHLLAALLDAEFDRLAPHLEMIPMLLGDVLCESGGKLQHV